MRLVRWMIVVCIALVAAAIGVGVVMAAPALSERASSSAGQPALDAVLELTSDVTPSLSFTHPVALAISQFFGITYTEVISQHQSGLGFGEIARAYMIAQSSGGTVTAQQVLALRQSGMGWGQIMKEYSFRQGGKGLGSIMSGHNGGKEKPPGKPDDKSGNSNRSDCPGNSCNAPGHGKGKK